jgi:hypothetical protein
MMYNGYEKPVILFETNSSRTLLTRAGLGWSNLSELESKTDCW